MGLKKIEVTCMGCGKKHDVVSEPGHASVVKCDCGASIQIKDDPSSFIKELGPILDKIPGILGTLKQSRRQGFETGIDAGLHEVARQMVLEIMKEDAEMREAMKESVKDCLDRALFPEEPEGPSSEHRT